MNRADAANAAAWVAWAILVFGALARAVVTLDPFPHWEMDPTVVWSPAAGLGPSTAIALDLLVMLGAGLALLVEHRAGRGVRLGPLALLGVAAVPIAWHAFGAGGLSPDDARIGISWLAAGATAIAIVHLCRDDLLRRVTLAAAAGAIGTLAAKGALQVFIEHPENLRNFALNQDAVLASHGWSPDSPMARGFVRRLSQAEATGWFGLANVFASFAAAATVALLGMTVLAWRSARSAAQDVPDGIAAIVTLGSLAAAAAVWMAGSKAGYAVTGLGLALLTIGWLGASERRGWLRVRTPIPGGPLAVVVVAAMLVAVALRGAIGEAIREPSILFRWFYFQGAARIALENPIWGVGPAGFKDAYMVAKPAIAPESVDSPHSIVFDYVAKLGLGGWALAGIFFWLLWRCGTALTRPGTEQPTRPSGAAPAPTRSEAWPVILAAAAPTLFSAWMETSLTTVEAAVARALGAGLWIGIGLALVWVMRCAPGWLRCFAAAGIALAAHAQIEMTPIQPASAALFMLLLAASGAGGTGAAPAHAPRWQLAGPVALIALSLAAAWWVLLPIRSWESDLRSGAEAARPLAEIRARLMALPRTAPAGLDTPEAIATELGALLSRPPPRNDAELQGALTRLTLERIDLAIERVGAAARHARHQETFEAISRLHLGRASACAAAGDADGAAEHGQRAETIAEGTAADFPAHAPAWGWLGTVRSTRASLERNTDHLVRALDAWKRAAALDPHGLNFPRQIYRTLLDLQQMDDARIWAARVIAADDGLRLDPLLQLSPEERQQVERVARGWPP